MMKIRSFFALIILFIILSLSILSISTIQDNWSRLQLNIAEQNRIEYLQLLLVASEKIYDEHQISHISKLYNNPDPINYNPANIALKNLIAFSEKQSKSSHFLQDKYTALEIKRLSNIIRKNDSISSSYSFNRLSTIIEHKMIRIPNSSIEFMISVQGIRLTNRLYSSFTELIDQLIDICKSNNTDTDSKIKAIKLLGGIDEIKDRLITIQKFYLNNSNEIEKINDLVNEIFNNNSEKANKTIYKELVSMKYNDINIQQINVFYLQNKQHISLLSQLLLKQATDIANNQINTSKIKIYTMVCFLIIFFLFSILPIIMMIFKLSDAFSLIQKAILQLSNNDLNINLKENQRRFSFELDAIISSLIKLKNIQIEKHLLENKNQQLIHQLKLKSTTDYLTSISNRRAFLETIKHSSPEYFNHSSLAIIDIDNFKQINDKFGHASGDEVLIKFSQLLSLFFRKNDLFCRYGGEEFAILLHDCDHILAKNILEKLCTKVRYLSVALPSGEKIYFTISIGIAEMNNKFDINQTIIHADKALYHSKATGKDRVTVYTHEMAVY
ncbi:GGDEF domain-containing protein [Pragia fontium]|uniref:GGDEF domain-containing protein n=1 Tax=Pragia fontium TaxID=82985 RepID=UPI0021C3D7C4|nr:GGDEF domain-containing protein [Pragia fontium]